MCVIIYRNNLYIMLIDILLVATVQILRNLIVKNDVCILAADTVYLDFDNLPETNFSCNGKVIGGYYADVETGCQMFHVCTLGQKAEISDIKFLCLNGTVFDQQTRVCEREDEVDCSRSETFYSINLDLYGNRGNSNPGLYGFGGSSYDDKVNITSFNLDNSNFNNLVQKPFPQNGTVYKLNVVEPTMVTSNLNRHATSSSVSKLNGNFATRPYSYSNLPTISFTTAASDDGINAPTTEETAAVATSADNPTSAADVASQLLMLHETFKQNLQNYNVSSEKLFNQNPYNRNNNILNTSLYHHHHPSQSFDTKPMVNHYPFSRIQLPPSSPLHVVSINNNNNSVNNPLINNDSFHWRANNSYQISSSLHSNDDDIKRSRAVKPSTQTANIRDVNQYDDYDEEQQLVSSTSQYNNFIENITKYSTNSSSSRINKPVDTKLLTLPSDNNNNNNNNNNRYRENIGYSDSYKEDDDYDKIDGPDEIIAVNNYNGSKITASNHKRNSVVAVSDFSTSESGFLPSFNSVVVTTDSSAIIESDFIIPLKGRQKNTNSRYDGDKSSFSTSKNETDENLNAPNETQHTHVYEEHDEEGEGDYYYY